MIIAVDFDGTIVENRYPEIGRERPFAVQALKMLIEQRHQIILWTVRHGRCLDEAVSWCTEHGLEFYAVNTNYPEEKFSAERMARKIDADIFIDDRSLGGIPDWGVIYRMITENKTYRDVFLEEQPEEEVCTKPRFKLSNIFSKI